MRYKNYGHIRGAKAGDGRRAAKKKREITAASVASSVTVTRERGDKPAVGYISLTLSHVLVLSCSDYSPGTVQDEDNVKGINVATTDANEVSEQGERARGGGGRVRSEHKVQGRR